MFLCHFLLLPGVVSLVEPFLLDFEQLLGANPEARTPTTSQKPWSRKMISKSTLLYLNSSEITFETLCCSRHRWLGSYWNITYCRDFKTFYHFGVFWLWLEERDCKAFVWGSELGWFVGGHIADLRPKNNYNCNNINISCDYEYDETNLKLTHPLNWWLR